MNVLIQMVGVGLVILAIVDIYLSVLYPRLGSSVLSARLGKAIWCLFRETARLKTEGLEVEADLETGANLYISLRHQWCSYLSALTDYLDYRWSEISPTERGQHC